MPREITSLKLLYALRAEDSDQSLIAGLRAQGHRVEVAQGSKAIAEQLRAGRVDALILETGREGERYLEMLRHVGAELAESPVVLICDNEAQRESHLTIAMLHCDGPVAALRADQAGDLAERVAELHGRTTLERENRLLTRDLLRTRDELTSSNTCVLEHRRRLLRQESMRAMLEVTREMRDRLNQPLSVLMGNAEILRARIPAESENLARLMERVVQGAEEIDAIVGRMTTLQRHRLGDENAPDYMVDLDGNGREILIAVSRPERRERLEALLHPQRRRIQTTWCTAAPEALEKMSGSEIDLALVDVDVANPWGMEMLREANAAGSTVPVIALTETADESLIGETFRVGAVDYLPWNLLSSDLLFQAMHQALRQAQIDQRLKGLEHQLYSQAALDPATGLSTPHRLESVLVGEFERAKRHSRPMSVLVFTIDHWGDTLASLGQQRGEEILHGVGRIIAREARQADCVAMSESGRYVAVLPETKAEGAQQMIARLTARLGRSPAGPPAEADIPPLTLTGGVCEMRAHSAPEEAGEVERRACEAWQRAEAMGGGLCLAWEPSAPPASAESG